MLFYDSFRLSIIFNFMLKKIFHLFVKEFSFFKKENKKVDYAFHPLRKKYLLRYISCISAHKQQFTLDLKQFFYFVVHEIAEKVFFYDFHIFIWEKLKKFPILTY